MRNVRRLSLVLTLGLIHGACSGPQARVAESGPDSGGSYTEKLKRKLEQEDATQGKVHSDSYIDSVKKKLDQEPQPVAHESFIEAEKRKHPENFAAEGPSYIEKEKAKLEPKAEGGAIAAYNEGRSELKFTRKGDIHSAFGFRYGASLAHSITAVPEALANDFDTIYGKGFSPDASLFYEYQMLHSEIYGTLGVLANFGVGFYSGAGRFAITLGGFSPESHTQFQFFALPLVVGPTYRLNLTHYLIPFVTVGPALIPYFELRNDEKRGFHGMSKGLYASGGVMLPIDWLSRASSADLYYEHGVKRTSLTAEYSRLSTLSGDVTYNIYGLNIGLIFEY